MSKQDRQGVRTPADIERKYDLGKNAEDIRALVVAAQRAAASAEAALMQINNILSQEGIIELLTNGGEDLGIYAENGEVLMNASYIKKGVLKSADGVKIVIDLDNGTVFLSDINTTIDELNTKIDALRQELVDKGILESEE